ncbi:MAG: hypothetical protein WC263_02500 [Candidatus Micrarchaeia archaeon]
MGAMGFLAPSVKKAVVFAAVYLLALPLLFCAHAEFNCQATPGGYLGCSCMSVFNTISLYPAQYLTLVAFGLFSFTGYFALLWLGVLGSYLLACVIACLWWGGKD